MEWRIVLLVITSNMRFEHKQQQWRTCLPFCGLLVAMLMMACAWVTFASTTPTAHLLLRHRQREETIPNNPASTTTTAKRTKAAQQGAINSQPPRNLLPYLKVPQEDNEEEQEEQSETDTEPSTE